MARPRVRRFGFRGLSVVHEEVEAPMTAIALSVRAGARFDGEMAGLAHMAEHMLFQGTDALDQLALNRRAAEVGSSHNASTGYETIALTLEVFNEDFFEAIRLLTDQFYRSRAEASRFAKERRVVQDEIRSYQEDPLDYLHERGWTAFYGEPIGHPICGTSGTLRSMSSTDVVRFLRRYFVNANAVLSVVGGVSTEDLRRALKSHVLSDRAGRPARGSGARRGRSGTLRLRGGPRGQGFVACFLEVDPDPKNLLAVGVALDLVGADPDGALFQEVRERHGLGYDVSAELDWGLGWGTAVLSASARPEQTDRLQKVIDEVLTDSASKGFAPGDLARARKKRRHGYASLAERRLDRALAHADSAMTGFPPPDAAERMVNGLRDEAIVAAWRRAVGGRSLVAVLPG